MNIVHQKLVNQRFFVRLNSDKLTKPMDFTVFKPTPEEAVKHIQDVCMDYWGEHGFGKNRTITIVDEAVYV